MKTSWVFWLIAILGLIWNVMGSMNLIMQLNPEMLSQMPSSHQAIAETRPHWATVAFGISVVGGLLGCVLLILKKPAAVSILLLSLIGTLGAIVGLLLLNDITSAPINFSAFEIILAVILPVFVSLILFLYAKRYFDNHEV